MNIRNYAGISTAVNIILLALLFMFWKENGQNQDARKAAEDRYLKKIAHQDVEISRRNAFIESQDSARLADNAKHAHDQDSLQRVINRVTGRIIPTTILASQSPDTCRHLIAQLLKRDSVVSLQTALATDLKSQVDSNQKSYEQSIDSLKANVISERTKFEIADAERDSLVSIKPPSPWGIGISAGPGLLVTTQGQVYGGIGATIGVTYKIPITPIRLFSKRR